MGQVTGAYDRALRFVLTYPFALVAACLALIVSSFFCYRALGSDLLPAMDEGGFILDYLMPAGSSLADTNQVLLGVEKILLSTPEVDSTSRRTGLQLGLAAVTEANTGDFFVRLKPLPRRDIETVMDEVRLKVAREIPGLEIEADDVRCTHGSTSGRVDEQQVFYAMTRGYTRREIDVIVRFVERCVRVVLE
jgi:multidrug efflux pump subunit AcrB